MGQHVGSARQAVAWLLLVIVSAGAGCLGGGSPTDRVLLPEAQFDDGAAYEIIRHNTRYPESPDFTAGIEEYDCLPWFRLLLNTDRIPPDWESSLARAPRWAYVVSTQKRRKRLDSLVLRFTDGTRTIQITDNRTDLTLAVLAPEERFSLEDPEETVRALCREYLADEIAETWELDMRPGGGDAGLPWGRLGRRPREDVRPAFVTHGTFCLGPTFAAFTFRKSRPFVAVISWADTRRLFTGEPEPPLPHEAVAVRTLLMEEDWDAAAMAGGLRALERVFIENSRNADATALRHRFKTDMTTNTLAEGYRAFSTRLEGLRQGDPTGYDLVVNALAACPSTGPSASRWSYGLLRAVATAAQQLQDVRLAPLLMQEIRDEKRPDIVEFEADALCAMLKEGSAEALLPLIRESDATRGEPARRVSVMLRALGRYPTEPVLREAERVIMETDDSRLRETAQVLLAQTAPARGEAAYARFIESLLRDVRPLYEFDVWKEREKLPGKRLRALPDIEGLLEDYGRVEFIGTPSKGRAEYSVTSGFLRRARTHVRIELSESALAAKEAILLDFADATRQTRIALPTSAGSTYDIGDICFRPDQRTWTRLDCARANIHFRVWRVKRTTPERVLNIARAIDAELMRLLEAAPEQRLGPQADGGGTSP